MKAAVILLLGVFVCGVVCDPVANDDKQQTAETEYYSGPGRSRDRDDYNRRLDGDYGRHYHGDDDGYRQDDGYRHHDSYRHHDYPARTQACVCSRDLRLTPLTGKNGCTSGCVPGFNGNYCTGTSSPNFFGTGINSFCSCATTANFGPGAEFGACLGSYNPLTGGGLCYQATCPSDGTINLSGQAVPKDCNGCGVPDLLFIYKNSAFSTTVGDLLVDNQANGDVTVKCKANENFFFCENGGILVTSSLKATFTVQSTGSCAPEFTLQGSCKP